MTRPSDPEATYTSASKPGLETQPTYRERPCNWLCETAGHSFENHPVVPAPSCPNLMGEDAHGYAPVAFCSSKEPHPQHTWGDFYVGGGHCCGWPRPKATDG